jgi:hypothetical protein
MTASVVHAIVINVQPNPTNDAERFFLLAVRAA